MNDIGYYSVGNLRLRSEPARDAAFKVVRHDTEMHEFAEFDDTARREMVHRHMSNEITSLDIAAQCLADFPDAPWGLRMELARQCWDETRHMRALYRRLTEMGGYKGEFPVSAAEWNVTMAIDNLPGRLASQNRTFEAGAMDVVGGLIRQVRAAGDERTAETLDGILADEIQHVRFANRWLKRMVEHDRRLLLKVAQAIRFVDAAIETFAAKEGEISAAGKAFEAPEDRIHPINIEDRKHAEFTDEEIEEVLRQSGFRSLIPETTSGRPTP